MQENEGRGIDDFLLAFRLRETGIVDAVRCCRYGEGRVVGGRFFDEVDLFVAIAALPIVGRDDVRAESFLDAPVLEGERYRVFPFGQLELFDGKLARFEGGHPFAP